MPTHDWNEHYALGNLPWDTGIVDPTLVEVIEGSGLATGRVLEVGCGTGTNALWLASRGFDVVGVDVAGRAIDLARTKAAVTDAAGTVRFEVRDFLAARPDATPFDLVFDRGVFHVFDAAEDRVRFAAQVAACLAPSGRWLSLIGSTEGPPREEGSPRRSARDITDAIEPALELVELRSTAFDRDRAEPLHAWCCIARRRLVPAQPSTI